MRDLRDYRLRSIPADVNTRTDAVAAQWRRRERDGDPQYVMKRRKDFEREAARFRAERAEKAAKQAAADPGSAADPGGNPVEGGASLAAIAQSRLQRRRQGGD